MSEPLDGLRSGLTTAVVCSFMCKCRNGGCHGPACACHPRRQTRGSAPQWWDNFHAWKEVRLENAEKARNSPIGVMRVGASSPATVGAISDSAECSGGVTR